MRKFHRSEIISEDEEDKKIISALQKIGYKKGRYY
jgi:hypothetical protein